MFKVKGLVNIWKWIDQFILIECSTIPTSSWESSFQGWRNKIRLSNVRVKRPDLLCSAASPNVFCEPAEALWLGYEKSVGVEGSIFGQYIPCAT